MDYRLQTGVPAGSPEIVVDGVRLAVARDGKGPPVICLHAIGHGGGDFAALAAALGERFEIICIDWPGQGRSGPDRMPPRPRRYAQLVRGVVTALQLETPILIGCSIGGAAALSYATLYPVKALVLANSGGLVPVTAAIARACRLLSRIFAAGARGAWWYKPLFALYYRMVLPSPEALPQRRRIVEAAYETAGVLSEAWAGFAEPEADQRPAARALDVPVLFAWAMQDRINRFSAVAPVIRQMKRARVALFDGGHAAFLEQPLQFAAEFETFVRDVEAARPLRPVAAAE